MYEWPLPENHADCFVTALQLLGKAFPDPKVLAVANRCEL